MPHSTTPWRRLRDFLGLSPSMVGLLGMVVLLGMEEKMAERFLPVYLVALGGGAISVGLLNGLDNLLSAIYALPGGILADRIGTKRALLVFNGMAAAGFALVVLVPRWEAVILGAILFLSWSAISLPATMSLITGVLPAGKLTMGVTMHSLVRRIPMALGPIAGGVFIAAWGEVKGVRMAFVVALFLSAAAALLQQRMIRQEGSSREVTSGFPHRIRERISVRSWPPELRHLLVADILIRFCEQIPYAFVVLWCMKVIPEPVTPVQFGVLTAVEMATAMLIYIPVAYMADRWGKRPFVLVTFGFFTLFPVVLIFARSFWLLVAAFAIRGLKEFGEPARKALIVESAPEQRKASAFGLYYLIRDAFVSLAAFGGAFLWKIVPELNLMTAFFFGLAGTVWFAIRGGGTGWRRAGPRSRPAV